MNERTKASIPCNLCQGADITTLSSRDRDGGPLRTVACIHCGLAWSDPRPHDARAFYQEHYRLAYKHTFVPKPRHVYRAGKVALSRWHTIEHHLRGRMRVLDVGSGGGEFAYLLHKLGHEVTGVEPNRGYASHAAVEYGLDVMRTFIDEAPLAEGGYDMITMWHVLEHTEDPGRILRQLRGALRAGGILVVEVPNVEATCQAPRSTFHAAHLYSFNAATLERLARRSGLRALALEISADGGNITAMLQAPRQPHPPVDVDPRVPGNHARVAGMVNGHTALSHWLSAHPYGRLARRLARMTNEWWATRRPASGRECLDRLYGQALRTGAKPAAPGAGRASWPLILGTYAVAVWLEWLLLDKAVLPQDRWTEADALALYLFLQCAIIAAVVWVTRLPRTRARLAAFMAWAASLLALPMYC